MLTQQIVTVYWEKKKSHLESQLGKKTIFKNRTLSLSVVVALLKTSTIKALPRVPPPQVQPPKSLRKAFPSSPWFTLHVALISTAHLYSCLASHWPNIVAVERAGFENEPQHTFTSRLWLIKVRFPAVGCTRGLIKRVLKPSTKVQVAPAPPRLFCMQHSMPQILF